MGQNQYADWFVNGMLGWIRWLANNVARMFQAGSSGASSGNNLINWFSDNWIMLLLVLIVIGVLMDWLVWMIRWRPYWLWFRKKRVLLDDDIDMILSDEELMRRYAPKTARGDMHPHFRGSQLGRAGRPVSKEELDQLYYNDEPAYEEMDYAEPAYDDLEYGEAYDEDIPDIEDVRALFYDPYDEPYPALDEDDDYVSPREFDHSDEHDAQDVHFDMLYPDPYIEPEILGPSRQDEPEDDEPDVSFIEQDTGRRRTQRRTPSKKRAKQRDWLNGLRHLRQPVPDDDPFSVDDAEFNDPDDDFFSYMSDAPKSETPDFDELYEPKAPDKTQQRAELSEELSPSDLHTGDTVTYNAAQTYTSRKERRHQRENTHDS